MSDVFDDKKYGASVAIHFFATNVTTGASNQDLALAGSAGTYYIAPRPGSVVGITSACGAITAGTITAKPHLASTEYAQVGVPSPVLDATNDVGGTYATLRPGAIRFAAGAALGVSVTSTTTLDPTNTLDVDAYLHVVLDA